MLMIILYYHDTIHEQLKPKISLNFLCKTTLGSSRTSNNYNFKTKFERPILPSPSFSSRLIINVKTKKQTN